MRHYKYLIVGGGMSAASAIEGIRSLDEEGRIGLISAESVPPYDRPPLSKGLWQGQSLQEIQRLPEVPGVHLHLGHIAVTLDKKNREVTDSANQVYHYDKLLLATGGSPRPLPQGPEGVIYYRTLEDFDRLHSYIGCGLTFAVVGGGFIGSEIAAALAQKNENVTLLFPESGIGANRFPASLSTFLNEYYEAQGVRVLADQKVTALARHGQKTSLHLDPGMPLTVDVVVAGLGIEPNVTLAKQARLNLDNGIVVDEHLQTSHPDIYAAGDVASFYNPALDRRLRVEHADNANTMGRCVGRNMVGATEPYTHLPYFYSDLFDLGYEAVGETNSHLDIVTAWEEHNRKGIIYYLRDDGVCGVLLWNVWDQVKAATRLIADKVPLTKEAARSTLEIVSG
jgi:NADPH-dependent 2,4-dienoyl-CoA reductase/sulfur reductase-like enzyme